MFSPIGVHLEELKEWYMQAINIRQLKHNPSAALRSAGEDDFVVIMNWDEPQALLIDLKRLGVHDVYRVRGGLGVALLKQNTISLGNAARIADKTLPDMMTMLVKLGIPVVAVSQEEIEHDLQVADEVWA